MAEIKKKLEEVGQHAKRIDVLLDEIASESSYAAVSLMIINIAELTDSNDKLLENLK